MPTPSTAFDLTPTKNREMEPTFGRARGRRSGGGGEFGRGSKGGENGASSLSEGTHVTGHGFRVKRESLGGAGRRRE